MFTDLLEASMELPDQALDERIREIALQRRRLDAEFAAAIKIAENRQLGAVDAAGVAIDMGRRRRLFEGPARQAAKLLMRRCEHPGCELGAELCDVDHAHEWTNRGPTDQANSRIRCNTHNIDKTKHRWRSKRATNGRTYTIRPDGTIMLPIGARPPTFPTEDDPDHIEHLTKLARQRTAALRAA